MSEYVFGALRQSINKEADKVCIVCGGNMPKYCAEYCSGACMMKNKPQTLPPEQTFPEDGMTDEEILASIPF